MTYAGAKTAKTRNRHLTGLQQKAIMLFRAERPGKGFRLRCLPHQNRPGLYRHFSTVLRRCQGAVGVKHQPRFFCRKTAPLRGWRRAIGGAGVSPRPVRRRPSGPLPPWLPGVVRSSVDELTQRIAPVVVRLPSAGSECPGYKLLWRTHRAARPPLRSRWRGL